MYMYEDVHCYGMGASMLCDGMGASMLCDGMETIYCRVKYGTVCFGGEKCFILPLIQLLVPMV